MKKFVFTALLLLLGSTAVWAQQSEPTVHITTKATPLPTVEEEISRLKDRMVDTVGLEIAERKKCELALDRLEKKKAKIDAERAAIAARKEKTAEEEAADSSNDENQSQNQTPGNQ